MTIKEKAENYYDLLISVLKDLCNIPAPSGEEDERAKYCLEFVKKHGFSDAYIDDAKNVIWSIKGETDKRVFFTAHTDTVFPDRTPMPFVEDGEYFRSPGVGDDTASLAALLVASADALKRGIKPKKTFTFVANSCEEGLGNLKGTREIFKNFAAVTDRMYAFDGRIEHVSRKCVGSRRFEVTVETEGGHSFSSFGNTNAIAVLSEAVTEIYAIDVPKNGDSHTTYNVGIINGGTSVNTIAQKATMLCEYRSDNLDCMKIMQEKFDAIFSKKRKNAKVSVKVVGDRPCAASPDEKIMDEMTELAVKVQSAYCDVPVVLKSSSTDCNIPQSLGIPAVCCGAYDGQGEHTREEFIKKESLKKGFCIITEVINAEAEK